MRPCQTEEAKLFGSGQPVRRRQFHSLPRLLHGLVQKPLIGCVIDNEYHPFERHDIDQLLYFVKHASVVCREAVKIHK